VTTRRERREQRQRQLKTQAELVRRGRAATEQHAAALYLPGGKKIALQRCTHNHKIIYPNHDAAQKARDAWNNTGNTPNHIYPCPRQNNDHWHLTSYPQPHHCNCPPCRKLAQQHLETTT
jgi:hypothetical protein